MFLTKILILIVCLVQHFDASHSINVQCEYNATHWGYSYGLIYYCTVQNNPNIITRQSAIIESASGSHQVGQNNRNVDGFQVENKTINFFPRGLEKVFGDLKVIYIYSCDLKEVRQSDLKPFTQLDFLDLRNNEIKVLEKGLFDFNPMLVEVYLDSNQIVYIDVDVFQHLNKLIILYLGSNTCISKDFFNFTQVKEAITEAQQKCQDQDFLTVERNLKELEDNSTCSSSETNEIFKTKLEQIQSQVSNPKFSDFYEERIQKLAASKDQKCPTIQEEIQTTEKSQQDSKPEVINCDCLGQLENGPLANLSSKVQDTRDAVDMTINEKIENLEKSMNEKMSSLEASIKNLEKLIKNHISSI